MSQNRSTNATVLKAVTKGQGPGISPGYDHDPAGYFKR